MAGWLRLSRISTPTAGPICLSRARHSLAPTTKYPRTKSTSVTPGAIRRSPPARTPAVPFQAGGAVGHLGSVGLFLKRYGIHGPYALSLSLENDPYGGCVFGHGVFHGNPPWPGFHHDIVDCSHTDWPGCDFFRFGNSRIPLFEVFEITGVLKNFTNRTIHFYGLFQPNH